MAAAALLLAAAGAAPPRCAPLLRGIDFDTERSVGSPSAATPAACCAACLAEPRCVVFSWSNKTKGGVSSIDCKLDGRLGTNKSKSWAVSGVVRPGPAPTPHPPPPPPSPPPGPGAPLRVTISVETKSPIFTVAPHYLSYTIDTSAERGFFRRDLNQPQLRWLARQLAPAVLRVGGSGGDELYYDVPHDPSRRCPGPPFPKCKHTGKPPLAAEAGEAILHDGQPEPEPGVRMRKADAAYCLNTSQWDALLGFAESAQAKLVFGLNFFSNVSSPQVRSLLEYTARRNSSAVFGYEYGNEQIQAPQLSCMQRQARQGADLYHILAQLYPDPAQRPRLIGPDNGGGVSDGYVKGVAAGGAELFAYTFHQYSLSRGNSSSIPPSRLLTAKQCQGKARGLAEAAKGLPSGSTVELWAGEAGGAGGGGTDGVTNSFASGIWYLDSLGLYAATGTTVFARQVSRHDIAASSFFSRCELC
eukprot:COSAG04_NODE_299_length_17462_cov_3.686057_14_plen_472_part_00